MRATLKFLGVLFIAFLVMMAFRALVFTICTIDGDGLAPRFKAGDRVIVNRWSYGLRTGERGGLFDYGRLCRQEIKRGDIIAFDDEKGNIYLCRCAAVPGDTILTKGQTLCVVPGLINCADRDYYWVEAIGRNNPLSSEQLGFVYEEQIIGRACLVLYSHDPSAPFWNGYRSDRLLLPQ